MKIEIKNESLVILSFYFSRNFLDFVAYDLLGQMKGMAGALTPSFRPYFSLS